MDHSVQDFETDDLWKLVEQLERVPHQDRVQTHQSHPGAQAGRHPCVSLDKRTKLLDEAEALFKEAQLRNFRLQASLRKN